LRSDRRANVYKKKRTSLRDDAARSERNLTRIVSNDVGGRSVDRTLLEIVRQRLDQGGYAKTPWAKLVLAACSSDRALAAALDDAEWKPEAAGKSEVVSGPAYIKSVTVEGFRGIGAPATLELPPGNGLTLVVGRNGSGKSSFAEAVELLTTGTNRRWSTRSKVWRESWRNLHHGSSDLRVEFVF
jgi:hypothetical protein